MSNQIRIEFVLACILTKYYLTSQDPDVKFGETKFDDEGFALDYSSTRLNLSSKNFLNLNKQLLKLAPTLKTAKKQTVDLKQALAIVENDEYQTQLIKNSDQKKFVFYEVKNAKQWIWFQDLNFDEGQIEQTLLKLKTFDFLTIGGAY